MTDRRISELDDIGSPADDDELAIVDNSADETKKVTVERLRGPAPDPTPANRLIPAAGTTGQVLKKDSGADYDVSWADETGGTDSGGAAPTLDNVTAALGMPAESQANRGLFVKRGTVDTGAGAYTVAAAGLSADDVLDAAKANRVGSDRGKHLAVAAGDENDLVLVDPPSGGGGVTLSDDAVLDLADTSRTSSDRGKALGTSADDENDLVLLDIPDVPPRAGAFTAADEAKLDGIETGAQVNPPRAGAFTAADETKLDGIEIAAQVNPTRQDTIDIMTGDSGGDIDLTRDGSGASSDLRGTLRAGAVDTAELADDAVTEAKLDTSGTPSDAVFLRGDMTWAAPGATTQAPLALRQIGSTLNIPQSNDGTARGHIDGLWALLPDMFVVEIDNGAGSANTARYETMLVRRPELEETGGVAIQFSGVAAARLQLERGEATDGDGINTTDVVWRSNLLSSDCAVRFYSLAGSVSGGGGAQRSRQDTIDLLTGDNAGDVDFTRDGSGASSDLRGTIRAGAVGAPELAPGAVTGAKIAGNAITNQKMADDAVGVPELSASGTPSATTFLRGDNRWATPPAGTGGGTTDALARQIARENRESIDGLHERTGDIEEQAQAPTYTLTAPASQGGMEEVTGKPASASAAAQVYGAADGSNTLSLSASDAEDGTEFIFRIPTTGTLSGYRFDGLSYHDYSDLELIGTAGTWQYWYLPVSPTTDDNPAAYSIQMQIKTGDRYRWDGDLTKRGVDGALGTAAANDAHFYRGDGTWAAAGGAGSRSVHWIRPTDAAGPADGQLPAGIAFNEQVNSERGTFPPQQVLTALIAGTGGGIRHFPTLVAGDIIWLYNRPRVGVTMYAYTWDGQGFVDLAIRQVALSSQWNVESSTGQHGDANAYGGGGIAAWDAAITYPDGAVVEHENRLWISAQGGNLNHTPVSTLGTVGAWWRPADDRDASGIDAVMGSVPGTSDPSIHGWLDWMRSRPVAPWRNDTPYSAGDQVLFVGALYVCAVAHRSTQATAPDEGGPEWDNLTTLVIAATSGVPANAQVAHGLTIDGAPYRFPEQDPNLTPPNWSNTGTYGLGDRVLHNHRVFMCRVAVTAPTSTAPADAPLNWVDLSDAVGYRGTWASGGAYHRGDYVWHDSHMWMCRAAVTSTNPDGNTDDWDPIPLFRGEWNDGWFEPGDMVIHDGQIWQCTAQDRNGAEPPNNDHWLRLDNQAVQAWALAGDTGLIPPAKLPDPNVVVTPTEARVGYAGGASLGGTLGAVDDTNAGLMLPAQAAKLDAVPDGVSRWEYRGDWTGGTDYAVGDLARYKNILARCRAAHTASAANAPRAATMDHWELIVYLTVGIDSSGLLEVFARTHYPPSDPTWHPGVGGMFWMGAWTAPTAGHSPEWRYQNVVSHSGTTYVCVEPHTATAAAPLTPGTAAAATYWQAMA
ncbi:MAG: hypothetical protein OXG44_17395 [Gammaproteobacteria bacterium]|nr:hypothetical protein [Gammaproteobacteria bacterium]